MQNAAPPRDESAFRATAMSDLRNALLCGLAVVIAIALTVPISESPFNDDFSYSYTVKRLLQTHALTYNGWASASLIAQAYWGLIWVKAFGFSLTVLRFSTLPLAAGAVSICCLLARGAGLQPRFAVFASLMLGLSPLYLPQACSFMTDAPGLFCIMLSMYAMIRAIESARSRSVLAWLAMGLIVGFIGGTGRQIVWVVPLVLAPYLAWLRRDNAIVFRSAIAGWMLVFAGVLLTLHWFHHQPYSIPENSIRSDLRSAWHHKGHFIFSVLAIGLTLIWVILPAFWGVFRNWNAARALVAVVLFIGPAIILPRRPHYAVAPWIGNTLDPRGVLGKDELSGDRPIAMPLMVRIVFAIAVFAVACVLVADLLLSFSRPFTAVRRMVRFMLFPRQSQAVIPAMLLFSAAYFALLMPRCATDMVYDRYLLPIMPCVLFPILSGYQRRGENRIPLAVKLLFGVYTLYAIAITQDITAMGRARCTAVNRLLNDHQANIQPTQIDGGFEYNYLTQLETIGYINDGRIRLPRNAFKDGLGPTYAIQPLYRLELTPAADTTPTPFGYVSYFSYLYPLHRRIYIDAYTDPWWLNPRKAATRPADRYHHFIAPVGQMDHQNAN